MEVQRQLDSLTFINIGWQTDGPLPAFTLSYTRVRASPTMDHRYKPPRLTLRQQLDRFPSLEPRLYVAQWVLTVFSAPWVVVDKLASYNFETATTGGGLVRYLQPHNSRASIGAASRTPVTCVCVSGSASLRLSRRVWIALPACPSCTHCL